MSSKKNSLFLLHFHNFTIFISDFEIRSKSIGVCIHTSFKEILKCENGETVTRRFVYNIQL